MSALLLDSSVWLAARNREESGHEAAHRLIEAARAGEVNVGALDLTLYEVGNVAVRRWGLPEIARGTVELVRVVCGERLARIDEPLAVRAIRLSDQHGLSAYDAAYVACAQLRGWTLVSLDERDLVGPGHAVTPGAAL